MNILKFEIISSERLFSQSPILPSFPNISLVSWRYGFIAAREISDSRFFILSFRVFSISLILRRTSRVRCDISSDISCRFFFCSSDSDSKSSCIISLDSSLPLFGFSTTTSPVSAGAGATSASIPDRSSSPEGFSGKEFFWIIGILTKP